MIYIIYLIIIIIIILLFYYVNNNIIEHFCKIPNINRRGGINDKRVLLNYPPQSDIITSNCDSYWKDWPVESNSMFSDTEPIVMHLDQLVLPKERQFGNNIYKSGIIDFNKLSKLINDNIDFNIFDKSTEILVDPVTNKKLNYKYELDYIYIELNKKTWINRWEIYNPSVKVYFNYDDIKSPIENINVLNLNFLKRCNYMQKELLTNEELVLFGIIKFQLFKYKILDIKYLNNDINIPIYVIQISLFREFDLYLNTFSYVGYIEDKKIMITNVEFIGINSTDNVLLPKFSDKNEIKQEIINNNFSNKVIIDKDPDAIVELTKKYKESYKLKNQYACFNLNYDPLLDNDYFLPYYSRETCESGVDFYGRPKNYGVYDKPCEKNEDCPFYKINKNYENDYGKCINGKCELPLNMVNIGYRFYKTDKTKLPLCYNCNSKDDFNIVTELDTCCEKQFDTNIYPYLKSPDYAFSDDYLTRKNYFYGKYCKENNDIIKCDKIKT